MKRIFRCFGYVNVIELLMCIIVNFKLFIDFIIVSFNLYVLNVLVGFIDLGILDYYFIFVVFFIRRSNLKFKFIIVRNYKDMDNEKF